MTIEQYLDNINKRYKVGNATEHTFRGDLQQLLESICPGISATNEPKRQKCGAPDYILLKRDIPVGYIEAKDIGDKDLDGIAKNGNKEQFDRYKASLTNIIFTDYLSFHLYRDGILLTKISIAEIRNESIVSLPENFSAFSNILKDFASYIGVTIKSSKKLAQMMAAKARLLSDVIEKALLSDEENRENSTLQDQLTAFKEILIHDITPKGFADVYAQTIAYGMFAARLHDPTLPTFSRSEAAELIPKSNPFLRKLFGYIAGPDLDDRIKWIVDGLIEVFLACNVEEILKNYGSTTKTEDPIIHFYETFLSEYDPKLRKARGVWYTPQPVVNFIVRAVDDILKTEFNLPNGLADNSKTKIKVNIQATDKRFKDNTKTVEEEVHRVQILDPATGTGTFLAEVIRQIHSRFKGLAGIWSNYVDTHLIPRLNGFEILMASYAMAHLKLDLLLTETGYKSTSNNRFRVYLTNSLEAHHPDTGTLFSNWLSTEANEANQIKRDTPVMCVIGNPPYAISSINKGDWIGKLIADYKKNLDEKSYNSLSDDYVKFIRYGQHFIDKNGSGILAYISNNSYIDGIVFRQMRNHLLHSFDKIYILDLHGNSKKNEVDLDGFADQNVFDIMQGVSINIFVKTGKKQKNNLGKTFHFDLLGKRDYKYEFLKKNNLNSVEWKEVHTLEPSYLFIPKDSSVSKSYNEGIRIDEVWNKINTGVESGKDSFFIAETKEELINRFQTINQETINKFNIKDSTSFKFLTNLKQNVHSHKYIKHYLSKPFDYKYCYYNPKLLRRASFEIQKELIDRKNVAIICKRGRLLGNSDFFSHLSITNTVTDKNYLADQSYILPLYIYPEFNEQESQKQERISNLNSKVVNLIATKLNIIFTSEKQTTNNSFAPIDILDYIYSVLHSPRYRDKFKDFLKIDFPRVPYPKDQNTFWKLVKIGGQLRQMHLLESPDVENLITQYPVDGNNEVNKIKFLLYNYINEVPNDKGEIIYPDYLGSVFINETQFFADVPSSVWEFYIGGYQPAQKWLKDRKGRKLEYEDILHYQKIIVALSETIRLMKEIDKIDFMS